MTLQARLENLDRKFGFINNPEDFDFNLSPERIAYRNEALRTKDRDLYTAYLADHFPNEMAAELKRFDELLPKIRRVSKDEAEDIFRAKGINLLQADFSAKDEDSIFKMLSVAEEDLNWHLEGSDTDVLNSKARPISVLNNLDQLWLIID
ncbi:MULTISPECIES: hypothetical protein [unclassified Sphingobacterium]|uniref:hypothetical protein n=1 Tax=unclassified Sphingobacterium TaxID=2609468 RepID=UPI00265CBC00|nr:MULTISPECIES: hypothetical protein [unclassified Sphingobacterium]WKK60184.1 hypothetical protein QYC40_08040 [Sphingobacterium sp. BN32]